MSLYKQAFAVILILSQVHCQINITNTLQAGAKGKIHNISLASYGPNDILKIRLTILGQTQLSSTSMIVDMRRKVQLQSLSLELFQHRNPTDYYQIIDLDAMWSSRTQVINVRRQFQTEIFITVFNFDPPYRWRNTTYSLTIDPPGQNFYTCESCLNGERTDQSCFCKNCLRGMSGKLCSRLIQNLSNSINLNLQPFTYQYFVFKISKKQILEISVQGGSVQAYLQFQQFSGQIATLYNSIQTYYIKSNNKVKTSIDPQIGRILLTFASISNSHSTVSVKYHDEILNTQIIIIISVVCGIFLIVLVSIIVCIVYRRYIKNINRVNEQNMAAANNDIKNNRLTDLQIQRYFPTVYLSQLFQDSPVNTHKMKDNLIQGVFIPLKQIEESKANMMQNSIQQANVNHDQTEMAKIQDPEIHQKNNGKARKQEFQKINYQDIQCVICLAKIQMSDPIKIGYCEHIVHASCLIGWFKRQRNCPYCRRQYTRNNTISDYNKLVNIKMSIENQIVEKQYQKMSNEGNSINQIRDSMKQYKNREVELDQVSNEEKNKKIQQQDKFSQSKQLQLQGVQLARAILYSKHLLHGETNSKVPKLCDKNIL